MVWGKSPPGSREIGDCPGGTFSLCILLCLCFCALAYISGAWRFYILWPGFRAVACLGFGFGWER